MQALIQPWTKQKAFSKPQLLSTTLQWDACSCQTSLLVKNPWPRSFVPQGENMDLAKNKAATYQQVTVRNIDVKTEETHDI